MAALNYFIDLDAKKECFSETRFYIIDTKNKFDKWYDHYTSSLKDAKKAQFIFRGMSEAKHKLYTSAQRIWIQNDMQEWYPNEYMDFVYELVTKAKEYPLIKKVFDIYEYSGTEREFPILSILQHYFGPTPLMDWTYNVNVALFFATDNVYPGNGKNNIDSFFSIYRINKSKYKDEFLNIRNVGGYDNGIKDYLSWGIEPTNPNGNATFYISDFDEEKSPGTNPDELLKIIDDKHLTSVYNQNIIPQEGLFVFNPYPNKTIDEIFSGERNADGRNLDLTPFACFNIKKDLADYIRRRIKGKFNIDSAFIYPNLRNDVSNILNSVLNENAQK